MRKLEFRVRLVLPSHSLAVPTLTDDSTIWDLRARARFSPGNPPWHCTLWAHGTAPAASVPCPGLALETCFMADRRDGNQLRFVADRKDGKQRQPSRARGTANLNSEPSGLDRRPGHTRPQSPRPGQAPRHGIQAAYCCCQLSVWHSYSPSPLGASHMGLSTLEARGWRPNLNWPRSPAVRLAAQLLAFKLSGRSSSGHLCHQHESGVRNVFRGRPRRLTTASTATAGKEYGKLNSESSRLGPHATSGHDAHDSDGCRTTLSRRRTAAGCQFSPPTHWASRGAAPAALVSSAHEWRSKLGSQTNSTTF
jgi:hypothetical protein